MKFKKYATLILLTILVIGFSKNTVFAAAKAARHIDKGCSQYTEQNII